MKTVIDDRGREVPYTEPRRGRCGSTRDDTSGPCIRQAGHDDDHRSIRAEWPEED